MTFWFRLGTRDVVLLVRQVGGVGSPPWGCPGGVIGQNGVFMIFDDNQEKKMKKNEKKIKFFLETSRTNVTRMRTGEKKSEMMKINE